MSVNYADGLSEYDHKGVLGLPEIPDPDEEVRQKVQKVVELMKSSKCTVVYCGAGISTACGIPDFRGPNGVWTLEMKGLKVENDECPITLNSAKPSYTHLALASLLDHKYLQLIVSQNIDGLFLKSGVRRKQISELHGNFFLDECNQCAARYLRNSASTTMGLKVSGTKCPRASRPCRGYLKDTILDWEDELPLIESRRAQRYSEKAELTICMGTSLQIVPAANMPFICQKKNNGQVVIINLQKTKFDSKADIVIHDYVDNVMVAITKALGVQVNPYDDSKDVTIFEGDILKDWK